MDHQLIGIDKTFGALLIGALVSMGIYGITTLQSYYYYISYPKDGPEVKYLVAIIWLLDTVHIVLMCHTMYFYLITGFGNVLALSSGLWSLYASIAINVLTAFVSQSFFTKRIYHLSPERIKWWLSGVIGFTVFAHFFFGIETVVYFFIKKDFSRLSEVNFIAVLPFAILAILSDIFIAAALCLLLASSRSEFEDTNNVVNRLIVYAINRCVLTSAIAVIEAVIFLAIRESFYSFAFDFIIGKLYANSLLATLNSRRSLHGRGQEIDDSQTTNTALSFSLAAMSNVNHGPTSVIQVRTTDLGDGGRRRVGTMSDDPDSLAASSSMKHSNHSYPNVS